MTPTLDELIKRNQANTPSPAFIKAQQLLRADPAPADLEDQLLTLEQQIRPDERDQFGDLWSTFMLTNTPSPPSGD